MHQLIPVFFKFFKIGLDAYESQCIVLFDALKIVEAQRHSFVNVLECFVGLLIEGIRTGKIEVNRYIFRRYLERFFEIGNSAVVIVVFELFDACAFQFMGFYFRRALLAAGWLLHFLAWLTLRRALGATVLLLSPAGIGLAALFAVIIFCIKLFLVHGEKNDGINDADEPGERKPEKNEVENTQPHLIQIETMGAQTAQKEGQDTGHIFVLHSHQWCFSYR